jgi:hypothetical protein
MLDRFDPRDRDDDPRADYGVYDPRWNDSRDRDRDPRDAFVEGLDLPRGLEREIVVDDRDRTYELNGEDSRTLATVGAFRGVRESDLRELLDDRHRPG